MVVRGGMEHAEHRHEKRKDTRCVQLDPPPPPLCSSSSSSSSTAPLPDNVGKQSGDDEEAEQKHREVTPPEHHRHPPCDLRGKMCVRDALSCFDASRTRFPPLLKYPHNDPIAPNEPQRKLRS